MGTLQRAGQPKTTSGIGARPGNCEMLGGNYFVAQYLTLANWEGGEEGEEIAPLPLIYECSMVFLDRNGICVLKLINDALSSRCEKHPSSL